MMRLRLLTLWLLCLLASVYAAVRMLYAIAANPRRAWTLYQAHDRHANAARGGDPDQTVLGSDNARPLLGRLDLFAIWLASVAIEIDAALRMLIAIFTNLALAWVISVSSDQLANAAANGALGETISSRANRARTENRRWGCILCRLLDWIDRNHCSKSAGI